MPRSAISHHSVMRKGYVKTHIPNATKTLGGVGRTLQVDWPEEEYQNILQTTDNNRFGSFGNGTNNGSTTYQDTNSMVNSLFQKTRNPPNIAMRPTFMNKQAKMQIQ
eukprot:UN15577